jgi:predicted TIM-barrel fold metal-dependent hydrolase
MIVDSHAHLGYDYVYEEDFTAADLLDSMKMNRVSASIVQPGTVIDLETVVAQHSAIAAIAKDNAGRIFGMANPNPYLPEGEYRKELARCIEDLSFVGVKLNPPAHGVNPALSAGRRVFRIAEELGIPVMVHTGNGIPWSLPSALIGVAMDFKDLKLILAHAGGSMFASEAALAARLCPNIYLETSWLPGFMIRNLCRALGPDRIMFGSDHGDNVATELAKFRTIGLTDDELDWCLGRTVAGVFGLPTK